MHCRKCGAELLDTDTFCVKCGQKVEGPAVCPKCGEPLRNGTKFCHKCGAAVMDDEEEEIPLSIQKTSDIPFDQIEQNILLEARQAVVKRKEPERPRVREEYDEEYDEEEYEDEDDYEEKSGRRFSALTLIPLILILFLALGIAFVMWKKYGPVYGDPNSLVESSSSEEVQSEASETEKKIRVVEDVRVRSGPSTKEDNVLGVANEGEEYSVIDMAGSWYHISWKEGKEGYVYKDYVKEME